MAKLSAHGTKLATFEYSSCRVVFMSDGHVFKNYGCGWRYNGKAKPDPSPSECVEARQHAYDARASACPAWVEFVRIIVSAVALKHRGLLCNLVVAMPSDADGVWASMDDAGVSVDLDDIVQLCRLYDPMQAQLKVYRELGAIEHTTATNGSPR